MANKADLEALVDKLAARVEELERKAAPPAPPKPFVSDYRYVNPIDRVGMSPEVHAEFAKAIPTGMVREIVGDAHRNSTLRALGGEAPTRPRGNGWRDAAPLSNPPGTALADKLVDVQDARDRAALIVEEGKRRAQTKARDDAA